MPEEHRQPPANAYTCWSRRKDEHTRQQVHERERESKREYPAFAHLPHHLQSNVASYLGVLLAWESFSLLSRQKTHAGNTTSPGSELFFVFFLNFDWDKTVFLLWIWKTPRLRSTETAQHKNGWCECPRWPFWPSQAGLPTVGSRKIYLKNAWSDLKRS